jgi:hypothetical protein
VLYISRVVYFLSFLFCLFVLPCRLVLKYAILMMSLRALSQGDREAPHHSSDRCHEVERGRLCYFVSTETKGYSSSSTRSVCSHYVSYQYWCLEKEVHLNASTISSN